MRIAIVGAGFAPGEADRLRRAMATFKRVGTIDSFREKFLKGMAARGHDAKFAERLLEPDRRLRQLRLSRKPRRELRQSGLRLGLDQMPLPGRVRGRDAQQPADGLLCHGAARARRAGAWRRGAAGRCQSLGLGLHAGVCYAHLLHRDGTREAVREGSIYANPTPLTPPSHKGGASECSRMASLHPRHASHARTSHHARAASRLPPDQRIFRRLGQDDRKRPRRGFDSVRDLWLRTRLPPTALEKLAQADAFRSLGLSRRDALWAVQGAAPLRRQGRPAAVRARRHAASSSPTPTCRRCRRASR